MRSLLQGSSIFQNCVELILKGAKFVAIIQDCVLVYGTTKEQYKKWMLAVKIRLLEKNFTINEQKLQLQISPKR